MDVCEGVTHVSKENLVLGNRRFEDSGSVWSVSFRDTEVGDWKGDFPTTFVATVLRVPATRLAVVPVCVYLWFTVCLGNLVPGTV